MKMNPNGAEVSCHFPDVGCRRLFSNRVRFMIIHSYWRPLSWLSPYIKHNRTIQELVRVLGCLMIPLLLRVTKHYHDGMEVQKTRQREPKGVVLRVYRMQIGVDFTSYMPLMILKINLNKSISRFRLGFPLTLNTSI